LYNPASKPAITIKLVSCRKALHPDVYKAALVCWLLLLAVFWITFSVSANATFMVAIGTVYAAVFFGVPYLMSRMAKRPPVLHSLSDFVRGRFDTIDGPIGGGEALLQVILVPLALTLGGTAIGFIIRASRGVQ
jgi:hypothetical protein